MAEILILEDQEDSYELIKHGVDSIHHTLWAQSVADAKKLFLNSTIDLAIVDISLPDGDGFEFCGWVRQNPDFTCVPIIFVSSNQSVESRITGLMIGGDDYLSKPFHLAEMRARIESKLRFRNAQLGAGNLLKSSGIVVNLRTRQVFVEGQDQLLPIELTPIEFKILHCLIEEPGKACDREDILNRVWGKEVYVYPRSVDTHVSKLRKKLGSKGNLIMSVHGAGYRLGQDGIEKQDGNTFAESTGLPAH